MQAKIVVGPLSHQNGSRSFGVSRSHKTGFIDFWNSYVSFRTTCHIDTRQESQQTERVFYIDAKNAQPFYPHPSLNYSKRTAKCTYVMGFFDPTASGPKHTLIYTVSRFTEEPCMFFLPLNGFWSLSFIKNATI